MKDFLLPHLRSESFCAISFCMEALLTYRGKRITQEDVAFIRELIAQNPGDSRWRLISETLSGLELATGQWGLA